MIEVAGNLHIWIDYATIAMELFAVGVIVAGIVFGAARFVVVLVRRGDTQAGYDRFKAFMGRTLLLGLEILVAADVVRTVALEPTMENVLVLGILVLIRTFLSWSLVVEIEGRWPWQKSREENTPVKE